MAHSRFHPLFLLFLSLLLSLAWFSSDLAAKERIRITMPAPSSIKALPRGLDVVGGGEGYIDAIVDGADLAAILRTGFPVAVLDADVEAKLRSLARDYHTYPGMVTELQNIAATYPNITKLTVLGQSYQNRDIPCLEISDNPGVDEGEAEVLFVGLHHAREWPSLEEGLYICQQLTAGYGNDPDITDVVNNRRVFVIPCINVDGYVYSHDQGHDWRKNRHYFSQYGTWGVDLNRNYGGSTNGAPTGDWGDPSSGGATHYPSQETYCGPASMSEPETQVLVNFIRSHRIVAGITYHTYSELVLWPWGYNLSSKTPDDALLKSIGQGIASRITRQSGSGTYTPEQSASLYPTTGDTTDWAYGSSFYENGRSCFLYTVEMCSEFHPSWSKLPQVLSENFDGALYLMEQAETIRTSTTPWPLPPLVDAPAFDNDGDYTVSWTEVNPAAGADFFRLDELSGLTVVTDDAESGSGLFDLSNFSLSTNRYHSAGHSFKSHHSNAKTGTMTTKQPVPVAAGDLLTFWTWYDIEDLWDYGVVEVSLDGRQWDDLGLFTGSSGGWIQKSYPLDAYEGKSIYIRFTYTTDAGTLGEGFYVDDIRPVPDFDTINTLSSNITGTSFHVTGRPDGDYYYRVAGHSPVHGWADFSFLDKTTVNHGGSDPLPDIKVDGQDGPLTVSHTQIVTMTVSLDPGGQAGVPHDWWVFGRLNAMYSFWWTLPLPGTWTYSATPKRAWNGGLMKVNDFIVTQAKIPAGSWIFTFAVDQLNNAYEGTYSDTIDVTSN